MLKTPHCLSMSLPQSPGSDLIWSWPLSLKSCSPQIQVYFVICTSAQHCKLHESKELIWTTISPEPKIAHKIIIQQVTEWLMYTRHSSVYCGNRSKYQRNGLHLKGIYIVLEETESKPDK